ncbi:MAG: ribosome silencing factor [Verrucomicrobiota bacterium]
MPTSDSATATLEQIHACCQALHDKKAENLTVLYMGERSTVADYFVIATGTSDPHLRALAGTVIDTLRELGAPLAGADRSPHSGWGVVDAYDFLVHVFTDETRRHFNLEGLWKDAEHVELELS